MKTKITDRMKGAAWRLGGMLFLVMLPLAGLSQQGQGRSFEVRLKEATKPWDYGVIAYVAVDPAKEDLYLEFVEEWAEEIDNRIMEKGYALQSGWNKTDSDSAVSNYVYWMVSREVEAMLPGNPLGSARMNEVWREIAKEEGEAKAEAIKTRLEQKFEASAKMIGTQTVALIDWTYATDWEAVDFDKVRIEFGQMVPREGKEQAYVALERDYFSKLWQSHLGFDFSFTGWSMMKEIASTGVTPEAPYITIRTYRSDKPSPTAAQWEAFRKTSLKLPEGTNMGALREFTNTTYRGVHTSDATRSPEAKAWSDLVGTWTARNPNGGWRTKTISPFIEQIQYFGPDGKMGGEQRKPMSIRHIKGLNYFSAHMSGGNYTSIFDVHDGKWYEQSRSIFEEASGQPDRFFIYSKSDQPEPIDRSAFTRSGPEIEQVKATVQAYAAGDIDAYLSHFTENATAGHNSWSREGSVPVSTIAAVHRDHHRQLAGKIEITKSIYELVTLKGGGKHAHAWLNFKHTYKTGEIVEVPVFVAFGINRQNKITYEWAFYDSALLPKASPYKE
jgi:hypothetical protein